MAHRQPVRSGAPRKPWRKGSGQEKPITIPTAGMADDDEDENEDDSEIMEIACEVVVDTKIPSPPTPSPKAESSDPAEKPQTLLAADDLSVPAATLVEETPAPIEVPVVTESEVMPVSPSPTLFTEPPREPTPPALPETVLEEEIVSKEEPSPSPTPQKQEEEEGKEEFVPLSSASEHEFSVAEATEDVSLLMDKDSMALVTETLQPQPDEPDELEADSLIHESIATPSEVPAQAEPEAQEEEEKQEQKYFANNEPEPEDTTEAAEAAAMTGPANAPEDLDLAPAIETDGPQMDPSFFYSADEVVWTGPSTVRMSNNVLTLHGALGYPSRKPANLFSVAPNVLVFVNGAMLQFTDLTTGEQNYLRTVSGGAVGALAVHGALDFVVVAENGTNPDIIVYDYPGLLPYRLLRKGALRGYAHVSFNANGTKLASVATAPDYTLTLWDWRNECPILRTRAFASDVWRVTFSGVDDGQLTTSGPGHIRFWKLASTFTGLKLQGETGKFGRTELSDIAGYVELPDGKVLSGSEWGNLLLWEGGLIKCELARKGRRPCHAGALEFVALEDGDIITAGADGYIRIWNTDTIDAADRPTDIDPVTEVEPMSELRVGLGVHIIHMTKRRKLHTPSEGEEASNIWFVQDAGGRIWQVDLAQVATAKAPAVIIEHHAGAITGVAPALRQHVVATGGADGCVRVYDYVDRRLLTTWAGDSPCRAVAWAPLVFDPTMRSLMVGFADGVLRILRYAGNRIVLARAIKPHTGAITIISVAPTGRSAVTVAQDNTIFFAHLQLDTYEPLGFVTTPAGVLHVSWAADAKQLIASLHNGTVIELNVPQPGEFDVHATYHLGTLRTRTYTLQNFAHFLPASSVSPTLETSRLPLSEGTQNADDSKTDVAETNERDGIALNKNAAPPSISAAWYAPGGATFFLTVGGSNVTSSFIFECSFEVERPLRATCPTGLALGAAVRSLVQPMGTLALLVGTEDGVVRVHDTSDLEAVFVLPMHDHPVLNVAPSFDNQYVLSAAADGTLFVYRSSLPGMAVTPELGPPLELLPDDMQPVDDIIDRCHYSLEEVKQKSEADKFLKTAEEKKMDERRTIRQLRKNFSALLEDNSRLPSEHRLPRAAFEMDPQMVSRLLAKTAVQKSQLRTEMAWELEKHHLANQKLQQHFLDLVDEPLFMVKGILTPMAIASYRLVKPSHLFRRESEALLRAPAQLNTLLDRALLNDGHGAKATVNRDENYAEGAEEDEEVSELPQQGSELDAIIAGVATLPSTLSRQHSKVELDRQKHQEKQVYRHQRRQQWRLLMEEKPSETSANPKDQEEIRDAQLNMGDFKLKSSADYTVPTAERINTTKKRNQLLVLRQRIHDAKRLFNREVTRLRTRKVAVTREAAALRARLLELLVELDQPAEIPQIPGLDADENPARRQEYNREDLLTFKAESMRQLERERAERQAAAGFGGGFGKQAGTESSRDGGEGGSSALTLGDVVRKISMVQGDYAHLPTLHQRGLMLSRQRERDHLCSELLDLCQRFDDQVVALRRCKAEVDVRLKLAEYKHVLCYQELVHLRVFDQREQALEERRSTKALELRQTHDAAKKASVAHAACKRELASITQREKQVQTTFAAVLGDGHKFEKFLTKMYRRRIKRARVRAKTGITDGTPGVAMGGATAESSASDSDSEDSASEEQGDSGEGGSDSDTDFDDSVCPAGLDRSTYDKVLALREQRLDIEMALIDLKKTTELHRKESDSLSKREKALGAALQNIEVDLNAFQLEKQAKLNQLDVAVPLNMGQIEFVEGNGLPATTEHALLVDNAVIKQLSNRINELSVEKQQQQKEFKSIRQTQARLLREKKAKEAEIALLQQKCEELQHLKFGTLIDLEALEARQPNDKADELKLQLQQKEAVNRKQLARLDGQLDHLKQQLLEATRANTTRISNLTGLTGDQKRLEKSLNSFQTLVAVDPELKRQSLEAEHLKLSRLADAQVSELESLRLQIAHLSRKSGVVLPPIGSHHHNGANLSLQ